MAMTYLAIRLVRLLRREREFSPEIARMTVEGLQAAIATVRWRLWEGVVLLW